MTQTIEALLKDFREYRQQFQAQAQEKLKEFFVEFWEKNPAIKTVIWTQYAPYFNDGDPCEFSVHDPFFTNAEGDDLDEVSGWGEYEGEKEGIWVEYCFKNWVDPLPEGVDEKSTSTLSHLLCSSDMEDVMKMMFEADSKVVATREGFQIEEHSHD